jgi:hypothetical protein
MKAFKVGQRVRKDMGVRLSGIVVHPMHSSRYTDGSYRPPSRREQAVFTRWDDGTQGWTHREFLVAE